MANLPLFVKHTGGDWNVRWVPNYTASVMTTLKPGMLFTQSQRFDEYPSTNIRIDTDENCCRWTNDGLFDLGDTDAHEMTVYARIDGYFPGTGYHLSAYSAWEHLSKHFPKDGGNRHTQDSYHQYNLPLGTGPDNWNAYADNGSYLNGTTKTFMQHIYDSLVAKGWNGSSNVSYQNFAHRDGYYAVRVRFNAAIYDASGNSVGTIPAGGWCHFTWSNQPVTGSSNKSWVRIMGYTAGSDPVWETLLRKDLVTFIDADLDYTTATPTLWHGYNISTMIDD